MESFIINLLVSLLLALLSAVCSYILIYLKKARAKLESEIAQIDDQRVQKALSDALSQLDELAGKTVGALEQTLAKDLRLAVKSGDADRNKLLDLSVQAFATVCKQMKPEYLETLERQMVNAEEYIKDTIESKVLEAKMISSAAE